MWYSMLCDIIEHPIMIAKRDIKILVMSNWHDISLMYIYKKIIACDEFIIQITQKELTSKTYLGH